MGNYNKLRNVSCIIEPKKKILGIFQIEIFVVVVLFGKYIS